MNSVPEPAQAIHLPGPSEDLGSCWCLLLQTGVWIESFHQEKCRNFMMFLKRSSVNASKELNMTLDRKQRERSP